MRYRYAAMTSLQALVLALIQGLTEFLPISSSAHAILTPILFGWPDQGLTFDIVTNAGTLTAVLVYFRRDLLDMLTRVEAWRRNPGGGAPMAPALVLATLPVVVAGTLFYSWIATSGRNALLIALLSIGFGLLLGWADHRTTGSRDLDTLTFRDAFWVGLAQAFALLPGTSRSGVTMTAGLFLGFSRSQAARFSFLLSIPVSFAALAHDIQELISGASLTAGWIPLAIGYGASALSAYLVIDWLLTWLQNQNMMVFVAYRVILGLVILGMLWVA